MVAGMSAKPAPQSTKSKRGGARPGAGRPRTKIAKRLIQNFLLEDLETIAREDLLPAVRELVRGVEVLQYDKKGNAKIYSQPPNATMAIYVMDRFLGRIPTPEAPPPAPIARPDDGFSTLILGDSAIRQLAQSFFAAMGQSDALRLGKVREPIDVDTVAPPDDGQRRADTGGSG